MKRLLLFLLAGAPIIGLLALLSWAVARSQGGSFAGFAVNASFGEAKPTNPTPANFTIQLLDGGKVTLAELKGKPVMIDFWASWCPPCRQEAPTLARISQIYQEKGIVFLGIDLWDSEQDARGFVDRYGLKYPNGIDKQGSIAIDLGVTGIPEKYFINREGWVVRKFIGPVTEDRLREALEALLTEGKRQK